MWIYTPAGPLMPALQSYWIAIHVTAMIIAIGMFIFGAVTTVMYLLSARHERRVAVGQEAASAGIMRPTARRRHARPARVSRDLVRVPRSGRSR